MDRCDIRTDYMEKDLTTSVYTFEDLIKGNFLYVDKTEYVWQLIRPAQGMYFLSRPRRFGKSLLISTLKAIFEGKKELFKGLALYDKPYKWEKHPVIHLSFGDYTSMKNTAEKVDAYLRDKVATVAESYSIKLPKGSDAATAFGKLIDSLNKKGQVVILVDEYDKPILNNISKDNVGDILMCLKGFYSVLKDRNAMERLLFITGVSKFSHVSLFSELNNLTTSRLSPNMRECWASRRARCELVSLTVLPRLRKPTNCPARNWFGNFWIGMMGIAFPMRTRMFAIPCQYRVSSKSHTSSPTTGIPRARPVSWWN